MAEHEREAPPGAIKVVDRRRFTAEGQAKPGLGPMSQPERRPPPVAATGPIAGRSAPPAEVSAARSPAGAPSAAEEADTRIQFLPFIASLATNALAALGVLPEGQGGPMPKDPQVAREYIDIIVMLERRTRGNLTADEGRTLTQLIADLRLHFVEATRSVQPARHVPGMARGPAAGRGMPGA